MKHFRLTTLLFLLACGTHKPSQPHSSAGLDALKEKHSLYTILNDHARDGDGFIYTEHCDSTLFSGLLGVVRPVLLEAARDADGQWFRRPVIYKECFANKESASTISRDMLLGVMVWAWFNKRLDVALDLLKYGERNDWIMGEGERSRTFFSPNLRATLAEIIFRLGGPNYRAYRALPVIFSQNEDYGAHLTMVHIFLRGEMFGSVSTSERNLITWHHNRSKQQNAFFTYLFHKYNGGDQTETINILLNESYFPADRLPTTDDTCVDWRWQRDLDSTFLQPCDEYHPKFVWSGADFLFVSYLVQRHF
jgi:hypothetical protein